MSNPVYTIQFGTHPVQPLPYFCDACMDQACKDAGLWVAGQPYPEFTVYENGEATAWGGGANSGEMCTDQRNIRLA